MKKIIASIFAFSAVLSLNAANNVSSNASATLEHNVSVSKVTSGTYGTNVVLGGGDLLFGNILITGAVGSVTVGANNIASYTGGAAAGSAGTIAAAAAFQVTGIQGNAYTVTIPDADIARASTGELLSVSFDDNASGLISATADNNVFMVGGTLSIPENAKVGSYSGSFSVTIQYN